MIVEVQTMFNHLFNGDCLNRILFILQNISQCRKINDIWPLYESLCSKIPLLEDEDLEKVSEEEK